MRCLATTCFSLAILLAAGCSSNEPVVGDGVDINAAAQQAQRSVDAYGAEAAATENAALSPANRAGTSDTVIAPDAETISANSAEPLSPPAPGTPGGLPDDRTPLSEAPFTPDSAQGAANVVQTYYALLGEGKYRQAWALWDDDGKAAGLSAADFVTSFARYSEYHANIGGPSRIDAGVGQRHVSVPVQVYARLRQGARPVYQFGSMTLHRVADIDGATAAQRRWRIARVDLKPAPPPHTPTTVLAAPRKSE